MWTAAILGGGQTRRLSGRDKSALVVGGRPILDRQLDLVRPLTPHVLAVGFPPGRVGANAPTVVPDRVPGGGALGGIYTALCAAPTDHVVVMACDMPFLTAPFLAHLGGLADDADVVVPRTAEGRHPLCARYHRRIADRLRARLDEGRLRVSEALDALVVREIGPEALGAFDPNGTLLFNVNTPEDYQRACALARDAAERPVRPDA